MEKWSEKLLKDKTIHTPTNQFPMKVSSKSKWFGLRIQYTFENNMGQKFETSYLWDMEIFYPENDKAIEKILLESERISNLTIQQQVQSKIISKRASETKIHALFRGPY